MNKTLAFLAILAFALAPAAFADSVANSFHNLARTGTGEYKTDASGTQMVCIFCHTPHSPVQPAPLWNRLPGAVAAVSYRLYSSTTMENRAVRTGFSADSISLLCLSCHDGSQLGGSNLRIQPLDGNSIVTGSNGETGIAPGRSTRLGPDLKRHHPVNFNVTASGEANRLGEIYLSSGRYVMQTTAVLNGLPLFPSERGERTIECATCHTSHDNDNPLFLRTTMEGSRLCLACHLE